MVAKRPVIAPRRRPAGRQSVPAAAAWAAGIGLGAAVALPLSQASRSSLRAPGGLATLSGDVAATAGTYLLLIMVLLAARVPALENALGQERLVRWHRWISSAPLTLLGAHVVLSTLGYAQSTHIGFWSGAASLLTTVGWIFASVVAYAMLVAIAAVSVRVVRRRMNYDSWWVVHLYTYLAIAFSVPHQIFAGTNFVGRPLVQAAWLVLWIGTAGVVVVFRLGLPLFRSIRHRLRLVHVREEGPGVYSLVIRGRHLDRLGVAGGQFFRWRFLTKDMWWHAHPFSLSAMPAPPYMRVTVKVAGDATARITKLRPGTRIAVEGPYGAFTGAGLTKQKVALVGAGVGVTPLRALLEDLPVTVDAVFVQRASSREELIHNSEIASLVADRRGRFIELVGPRSQHRLHDPRKLHRIIPDLAGRELYVCGPDAFAAGVVGAAQQLGMGTASIHCESFEL